MSSPSSPPTLALELYSEFLAALDEASIEFVVIGGAAVGAYARTLGETVVSQDLEILVPESELPRLLEEAVRRGAVLEKRPQPRSIPVAFLRWRGLEVNALTRSAGLAPTSELFEAAREVTLAGTSVTVPLLAPLDLLRNELAVRREKDLPHIALLERFIQGEIVVDFGDATLSPRGRLRPLRRLLDVTSSKTIPAELFTRLAEVALDAPSRRFLVSHAPTRRDAENVRDEAPSNERPELDLLLARREAP